MQTWSGELLRPVHHSGGESIRMEAPEVPRLDLSSSTAYTGGRDPDLDKIPPLSGCNGRY